MKKTNRIIAAIAISLFATSAIAQGTYAKVNFGYNFGLNSTVETFTTSTATTKIIEAKNLNFGKGINIDGTFGIMMNKNVGLELGLSYLMGGKTEMTDVDPVSNDKFTFSASMFKINPSIVLSAGFEKINPYAKFGLLIGFGSIKMEEAYTNTSTGGTFNLAVKSNGGMALGFNSAFGLEYELNEKMSIFGELNLNNLTYAPKKSVMTECTSNGVDQLPSLTTNFKETEYVDSYDALTAAVTSSPDKAIKQNAPFNSFGLNFGVKIGF